MEEKESKKIELKKKTGKPDKQKGNRAVLILLAITVGISLLFYLRNVEWEKINLKIDFGWLKSIGGSRTVTFE